MVAQGYTYSCNKCVVGQYFLNKFKELESKIIHPQGIKSIFNLKKKSINFNEAKQNDVNGKYIKCGLSHSD